VWIADAADVFTKVSKEHFEVTEVLFETIHEEIRHTIAVDQT
jgi:hypothetical protein